jgi:hypothetical protein
LLDIDRQPGATGVPAETQAVRGVTKDPNNLDGMEKSCNDFSTKIDSFPEEASR